MKIKVKKLLKGTMFVAALPLLAGCGGSGLLALGSLFGSGAVGGGAALLGGGTGLPLGGGEAIATVSNPEPASMILMGSGMAAMAYFRSKKSR